MYTTTNTARPGGIRTAFRRAEGWLDARGTWAWITAMVLGFIAFWPAGLALMAYMIWGKRMFSRSCSQGRHGNGGCPEKTLSGPARLHQPAAPAQQCLPG